jgi:sarcosine oxidase
MAQRYRVIVIGCGAVGAATAYWLTARRRRRRASALGSTGTGHPQGRRRSLRVIRHAHATGVPGHTGWPPAEPGTSPGGRPAPVQPPGRCVDHRRGRAEKRGGRHLAAAAYEWTERTCSYVELPVWKAEALAAVAARRGSSVRCDPESGIPSTPPGRRAQLARDRGATFVAALWPRSPESAERQLTAGGQEYRERDSPESCWSVEPAAAGHRRATAYSARLPITLTEEQVRCARRRSPSSPRTSRRFRLPGDDGLCCGFPVARRGCVAVGIDGAGLVTPESQDVRAGRAGSSGCWRS